MIHSLVFLIDVDNTLLDNDRFTADLHKRLTREFGDAGCARYWDVYERVRDERGYADYLETLQRFREGLDEEPKLLHMSSFLLDYPFAKRLYPDALLTIAHLHTLGLPVILSDGDVVFQPRKIQRSGLWSAVEGNVLVSLRKSQQLDAVQRIYPARHYVLVDDKPQLLAEAKNTLGDRLNTVFVRQGHYAAEANGSDVDAAADLTIEHIAELRDLGRDLSREGVYP